MNAGPRNIVTASLVAGLFLVASGIQAQKPTDDTAFQSTINTLTACSGYYSWMENFARETGKPSTADFVHNVNNGASMTASYMLMLQYNEANPR